MKELNPLNQPTKDNTADEYKYPKSARSVHQQSRPHRGLKMWAVNTKDLNDITEVRYELSSMPTKVSKPVKGVPKDIAKALHLTIEHEAVVHRVSAREGIFYTWALNKKNALKHYLRSVRPRPLSMR